MDLVLILISVLGFSRLVRRAKGPATRDLSSSWWIILRGSLIAFILVLLEKGSLNLGLWKL
jgi:hypothetical protein